MSETTGFYSPFLETSEFLVQVLGGSLIMFVCSILIISAYKILKRVSRS